MTVTIHSPLRISAFRNLLCGLWTLLCAVGSVAAATPILIVHSYSQEYPWTRGQHEGFVGTLQRATNLQTLISTEYLDTKRRGYDAAYARAMAENLSIKYAAYQPAAIYVSDDNALLFARDHLSRLFPEVPVIFSGVNNYAIGQTLEPHHFTGVFERKEARPNIEWLLRIDPGLRTLVFVGDGSNTHAAIEMEVRRDLAAYPLLQARFIGEQRLDRLMELLRDLPGQPLFLTTLGGMLDTQGKQLPLSATLRALSQGGQRRVVSMEDVYVDEGVLGGYVTHGPQQGAAAAQLLLEYLGGKALKDIPAITQSPNALMFDDAVLQTQKLDLPEDLRSQATLIRLRPSFIDKHRQMIAGSLYSLTAALFLVILGALYIVSRKNRALAAARAAAEKSGQLLREAVSSIAQGFTIYDENDRLVICNDAYRRFYAASADLIVPGNTFEEIVRCGAQRGQYAEANGRIDAWVAARVAQHQAANGEVIEQQLSDGRWLLIVEHRTPSGFIAGNRIDISELKHAAALIEDRNAQLDTIFRLSPDGLVSFDQNGLVKYANPAFLRMTGLLMTEIAGRPLTHLENCLRELADSTEQWPGLENCFTRPNVVAGATAGTGTPEQRHRLSLKRPRGTVLDLVGVHSDVGSVSRLLYVRDVTHETEVDRMKSEFLSHAAHELRTPMASIYGFTELLMTQEFDEATRHDLLATIYKQTEWLVTIINELLDLTRIEARRGKDFKIEAVPLQPLIQAVTEAMPIDTARWPLTVTCDDELPPARADAAKLRQALTNVLGNAVKYSPGGGGIAIRTTVREQEGRPFVGIAVTDHGIGMTPPQVARVGERFYRADNSGNIPGTGLGITIVKEVIELLGGKVAIDSTFGIGTTVTLWLQVAMPSPGPELSGDVRHD